MDQLLQHAVSIAPRPHEFEFSICTLVTKKNEYAEMLASFNEAGFTSSICEYLYLDNSSENIYDGYKGLNLFLRQAKGKYIIICHQDILIAIDKLEHLTSCLLTLDKIDPNWALCGNAGAAGPNHIVYHISYPNGKQMSKGKFPEKVSSLDENFLLIKNDAHLSFSTDLQGFHLYGTDLCLNAALNSLTAYVIPFNLIHKSAGNLSPDFFSIRTAIIKKYNRFFKSRWIQTTFTTFYLSSSPFRFLFGNPLVLFFVRLKNGILKKIT